MDTEYTILGNREDSNGTLVDKSEDRARYRRNARVLISSCALAGTLVRASVF